MNEHPLNRGNHAGFRKWQYSNDTQASATSSCPNHHERSKVTSVSRFVKSGDMSTGGKIEVYLEHSA